MILNKLQNRLARSLAERPVKILFVCLGNICRSPAAEGIMKQVCAEAGDSENWIIDSCGTGGWHVGDLPDKRMRVHALRRGLELDHVCRQLRQSDFRDFDIIIPMDSSNEHDLKECAPDTESMGKIIPMASFLADYSHYDHIPDPYYSGAEGFELVLDLLADGCRNLHDTVISNFL